MDIDLQGWLLSTLTQPLPIQGEECLFTVFYDEQVKSGLKAKLTLYLVYVILMNLLSIVIMKTVLDFCRFAIYITKSK